MHLFHYNYNRIHNNPILHVIVTRAYQLSFIDTYFLLSALCVCQCVYARFCIWWIYELNSQQIGNQIKSNRNQHYGIWSLFLSQPLLLLVFLMLLPWDHIQPNMISKVHTTINRNGNKNKWAGSTIARLFYVGESKSEIPRRQTRRREQMETQWINNSLACIFAGSFYTEYATIE